MGSVLDLENLLGTGCGLYSIGFSCEGWLIARLWSVRLVAISKSALQHIRL